MRRRDRTTDEVVMDGFTDRIHYVTATRDYIPLSRSWFALTWHVSGESLLSDSIDIRPLTLTGFIRAIARNFWILNYWRALRSLYEIGFLDVKQDEELTLKKWSWHPIRTRRARMPVSFSS